MKPLIHRIVLVLALLLPQTAIAVHDIQCLVGEHDQTCEVYFAQDHSASSNFIQTYIDCANQCEEPSGLTAQNPPLTFAFYCLSRAPPKLF